MNEYNSKNSRLLVPLGWALLALALAGLVPTGYLASKSMELAADAQANSGDWCSALGGDCTGALTSSESKVLGIALSYAGLAWYAGLSVFLFAAMLGRRSGLGWPHDAWPGMTFFAGLGAAVPALWLLRRFAVTTEYAICPLCVTTHMITLSFAALATTAFIVSLLRPVRHKSIDLDLPPGVEAPPAPEAQSGHFLLLGLVAATAAGGCMLVAAQLGELGAVHRATSARLAEIESISEVRDILFARDSRQLSPEDLERLAKEPRPFWGSAEAEFHLIEVTDFACPACRQMHGDVKKMLADWEGEVRVDVLQYPLSTDCNPGIEQDFHPHACEAHRAALAANEQGKFSEYVDLLFTNQNSFAAHPWLDLARSLDLDIAKFERDMNSQETHLKLKRDIEEGLRLKIEGTPRFVVGDKVLPGGTMPSEALEQALKDQAL